MNECNNCGDEMLLDTEYCTACDPDDTRERCAECGELYDPTTDTSADVEHPAYYRCSGCGCRRRDSDWRRVKQKDCDVDGCRGSRKVWFRGYHDEAYIEECNASEAHDLDNPEEFFDDVSDTVWPDEDGNPAHRTHA